MKKVTIADVAKAAGVAKSTVSRIINQHPNVKPETRNKVLKIIEQTGFSPSSTARSLKTNRRKQIALALDDIRNPFYPELAWAAEQEARRHNYRLMLINHYGNVSEELSVIEESKEMHIDGIIHLSITYPKTLKQKIKRSSVPVTLIGNFGKDTPADMVYLSRPEGYLAMHHLIRIGRSRIAYAGGPKELHQGTRFQAYQDSLKQHLMTYDERYVHIGSTFSLQTGFEASRYFASLDPLPDAVYAGNDMIAIGLIQGLEEAGLRVPEDIAVIGIDDIMWCKVSKPKLSSVSNMLSEMGRIAVEMLIERIESEEPQPYKRVQLEPRLVIRESTVKTLQ